MWKVLLVFFLVVNLAQQSARAEEILLPPNSHLKKIVSKTFSNGRTPDSGYWTRRHAHYLVDAGWRFYSKGKYNKALERFLGAIAMDDTDASGYFGVAFVCSIQNHLDDAICFYRLSLKYDQKHSPTFANLAKALLLKNPADEEAPALLNRALVLDPANGDALHTYVGYLVAKKDWSAAMNKAELAQKCGVRIHPELLRILNEHTQDTK